MEGWMYAKRLPALSEYKVSTDPSFTASRMEKMLPPHLQWAAQNFNHLHEQPTYFIGTILSLTYLGINDSATVKAAWAIMDCGGGFCEGADGARWYLEEGPEIVDGLEREAGAEDLVWEFN
ncbi:hypothetical protein Q7P35_012596 [Cladosporium inversicolor]